MQLQVTCTFDLENGSSQDYANAYYDLDIIGLKRVVAGTNRNVVIPTTMTLGYVEGFDVSQVCDQIRTKVKNAFSLRGLKSEIFITVGKDGTWGSATT